MLDLNLVVRTSSCLLLKKFGILTYLSYNFLKSKTDLCTTCYNLRVNIADVFDEETKLELAQRLAL
jgi:hypothetical protein